MWNILGSLFTTIYFFNILTNVQEHNTYKIISLSLVLLLSFLLFVFYSIKSIIK